MQDTLRIINPKRLSKSGQIPCNRIQVGGRMGYKPNIIKYDNGELLMANFHTHGEVFNDGITCEHIVLHRSTDGGKNWISQHYDHLWGREPYLNVFSHDVTIITTHFLETDVRNTTGHCTTWIHRSEDRGKTWESQTFDFEMIPDRVSMVYSSRNIIELKSGEYIMGIGCGHNKDYLFKSKDQGKTWQIERAAIYGFDNDGYEYSIFQEGVFHITESGRLLLFARCDIRRMKFNTKIEGLPDFDFESSDFGSDHYDVEIIFESNDDGCTWSLVSAIPVSAGSMYPSICNLGGNKYLFTYTQRIPTEKFHMGVCAIVFEEESNGKLRFDTESDIIIIDEKTPDYYDSGGGFGNTIMLEDGTFITPYSYLHADPEIDELLRTGKFLEKETFNFYRNKAYQYYKSWVEDITWEKVVKMDKIMQTHLFLGCCAVLNLVGPITEVTHWKNPEPISII